MATTNDITGDRIATKTGKTKAKFDLGLKLIEPSCFPKCSELVNTMPKCRVCDWKGKDANIQK